ncbi:hypothetical protein CSA37_03045 [Candidatus Fermentibacteria bacterium]|nr:MAG: hypothetical protein CSA37_03045 [Candidatus Fermentibacteria bacterium]
MKVSLEKLDFSGILRRVSEYTSTQQGKDKVLSILPAENRNDASLLQSETIHAALLSGSSVKPSLGGVDIANTAMNQLAKGAIALEPIHLRGAGILLRDVREFSQKLEEVKDDAPGVLHRRLPDVSALVTFSEKLLRITTPDGELSSCASPELKKLSSRLESLRSGISSRLNAIAARYAGSGTLRDSPPTIRSGRFVLPVASGARKRVKGIVHDRSESGATFFIEPSELVEAGNLLQETALDLEQEKRRILREATLQVREYSSEIMECIQVFTSLDVIYARAAYHSRWGTVFPEEGPLNLKGLVHPLLPVKTAVRSDIKLDESWRVLVVSGPNAGGKSVLLKAAALASVCSRAGLGAHLTGPSTMPFFSRVMVCMGDNQSIAMHLSTYSARLSEQIKILREGNAETLSIVDEPAGGTDPVTGAALAAVFLERTADMGVRTMVSTHMGQLKLLAMEKAGFINGSMSFDTATLTPGFRFIPDLPGASCTLEAAAIAGFPEDILSEASRLAGDSFSLDSLVVNLRELEEIKGREVEALKIQRRKAGKNRREMERKLRRQRRELDEIRKQTEMDRERELKRIRSEADSLLVVLANSPTREKRLETRKKLAELTGAALKKPEGEFRERAVSSGSVQLAPGVRVSVKGWPDPGTVEKVSRSSVMVRVGPMLLKRNSEELSIINEPEAEATAAAEYEPVQENPEAILLGQTVDEAIVELDIKLDNCSALGLKRLRVVHGKGRLMQGVIEWLRRDRRVRSVSMAPPEEGGVGASIVILKG